MPQSVTLSNRYGHELGIDEDTRSLQIIDYAHHEVHSGSSYHMHFSVSDAGAVADPQDTCQISFTTPNTTKWLHMIWHAWAGGECTFWIREAPSGGTVGGDALTAYNKNRNSSNTSGIVSPVSQATLATGGTLLHNEYMGQGNASSGESRGTQEFILKQNTKYAVGITDASNIVASITLDWYEHTDKTHKT